MNELRVVTARQDDQPVAEEFARIPVDQIDANPEQPRRRMNVAQMAELTDSVRQHGILQPVRVRPLAGRYQIIAGHRRVRAAREAGLPSVPAVVIGTDDDQALIEALVENIQRDDLNHVERGEALRRLRLKLDARSWEEVGRLIGIGRRHVYHLLNVAELPEPIREDVRVGQIGEKHCRALMRLRSWPDLQMQLWRRITAERMSGDEAMHQARELIAQVEASQESNHRPAAANGATAAFSPDQAIRRLAQWLPTASVRELRPLRGQLDLLRRRLAELADDGF